MHPSLRCKHLSYYSGSMEELTVSEWGEHMLVVSHVVRDPNCMLVSSSVGQLMRCNFDEEGKTQKIVQV